MSDTSKSANQKMTDRIEAALPFAREDEVGPLDYVRSQITVAGIATRKAAEDKGGEVDHLFEAIETPLKAAEKRAAAYNQIEEDITSVAV